MLKCVLATVVALATASPAFGQPSAPDAGNLLQQLPPTVPSAPPAPEPGVVLPEEEPAQGDSRPFPVSRIDIVGNTLVDTATLHALIRDGEGAPLTLAQLRTLAARITRYYRDHGYLLSRAIIPAQEIQDGVVRLQVIEAQYGAVSFDNRSRVRDGLVRDTLAALATGDAVEQTTLDRQLLLLSDLPATAAQARLSPGADTGQADLHVELESLSRLAGWVSMDGSGSRFTGRTQLGGGLSWSEPLRSGDRLDVQWLTSGKGVQYWKLAYLARLGGGGLVLGMSGNRLEYELVGEAARLGARGISDGGALWLSRPLLRSRLRNLSAEARYERQNLDDRVDVIGLRNQRHLDNLILSLRGDRRGPADFSSLNLQVTRGALGFDDANAEATDRLTRETRGSFAMLALDTSHLHQFGSGSALSFSLRAQRGNSNLDSSQKMSLGGPHSVRAYDVGSVSGDDAVLGTLELRQVLSRSLGLLEVKAFVDAARVRVNHSRWPGLTGDQIGTLGGAGLGVAWSGTSVWSLDASIAIPIGPIPDITEASREVRPWVTLNMVF